MSFHPIVILNAVKNLILKPGKLMIGDKMLRTSARFTEAVFCCLAECITGKCSTKNRCARCALVSVILSAVKNLIHEESIA